MMSTYEGCRRSVAPHTWMLFPAGWHREGDWPDLAWSAAPAPLLVQFLSTTPSSPSRACTTRIPSWRPTTRRPARETLILTSSTRPLIASTWACKRQPSLGFGSTWGSDREAVHFGHGGTPPQFSAIERHAARGLFTKDVFRGKSEFRNAPSRPPTRGQQPVTERQNVKSNKFHVKTCLPPSPKPRNDADQRRGQIAQPRGHSADRLPDRRSEYIEAHNGGVVGRRSTSFLHAVHDPRLRHRLRVR